MASSNTVYSVLKNSFECIDSTEFISEKLELFFELLCYISLSLFCFFLIDKEILTKLFNKINNLKNATWKVSRGDTLLISRGLQNKSSKVWHLSQYCLMRFLEQNHSDMSINKQQNNQRQDKLEKVVRHSCKHTDFTAWKCYICEFQSNSNVLYLINCGNKSKCFLSFISFIVVTQHRVQVSCTSFNTSKTNLFCSP